MHTGRGYGSTLFLDVSESILRRSAQQRRQRIIRIPVRRLPALPARRCPSLASSSIHQTAPRPRTCTRHLLHYLCPGLSVCIRLYASTPAFAFASSTFSFARRLRAELAMTWRDQRQERTWRRSGEGRDEREGDGQERIGRRARVARGRRGFCMRARRAARRRAVGVGQAAAKRGRGRRSVDYPEAIVHPPQQTTGKREHVALGGLRPVSSSSTSGTHQREHVWGEFDRSSRHRTASSCSRGGRRRRTTPPSSFCRGR
ncbi:hypothetical protein C8R45DRAFT_146584 [Mycena sanguinolenta]|nr:hypothetical protein C8R45DRAFT_146584 [Mycena sanguinolenta]